MSVDNYGDLFNEASETGENPPMPKYITPIKGGRLRADIDCGGGGVLSRLRSGFEAKEPVRRINNTGRCPITIAAVASDFSELNSVTVQAGGFLSEFTPPSETQYLIAYCDGCIGQSSLEYDDIPRV